MTWHEITFNDCCDGLQAPQRAFCEWGVDLFDRLLVWDPPAGSVTLTTKYITMTKMDDSAEFLDGYDNRANRKDQRK